MGTWGVINRARSSGPFDSALQHWGFQTVTSNALHPDICYNQLISYLVDPFFTKSCYIVPLALGIIIDMGSLTEGQFRDSIPDDIFQEARAASWHDDDGEDPFGPQPKRFMQTEHQKQQQKRDLEIRKVAWRLRKMRKDHQARRGLKKQKQRASPIGKLQPELILKLMQHIHLQDLHDFANSSARNRIIFKANGTAIYRGIEIEQFPDWKWIFGNTMHRTPAQLQHLKDAVSVEYPFQESGLEYMENFLQLLQTIDDNNFTSTQNVLFLQHMQDMVDMDLEAINPYASIKIARRTAICLRSLSFQRPQVVQEKDQVENGPLVQCQSLPWEARSQLITEQPASIQAEIRSILMTVIDNLYQWLERILIGWAFDHYGSPGHHRKPEEVKKWMSKLVTGLTLDVVAPQWYSVTTGSLPRLSFDRHSTIFDLSNRLVELLIGHNLGTWDALHSIGDVVAFGRSIGLNHEGRVEGTAAGQFVDSLGKDENTEA